MQLIAQDRISNSSLQCNNIKQKNACHGCIIHVSAFLENLGGTSSAQAASNAHCLRESIEISASDLLLTYLVFFGAAFWSTMWCNELDLFLYFFNLCN